MKLPGARMRRLASLSEASAPGFLRGARLLDRALRLAGRLRPSPESTRLSYRLEIYGRHPKRVP